MASAAVLVKLKLDENLSIYLKEPASNLGHDVTTAAEENLLGKPDEVVTAEAFREGRMLLTLDVGIADLRRFPPGTHPGIVVFRPRTLGAAGATEFVLAFLKQVSLDDCTGCIVVVDPERVRIRKPPAP